jgi:hypothetical protein
MRRGRLRREWWRFLLGDRFFGREGHRRLWFWQLGETRLGRLRLRRRLPYGEMFVFVRIIHLKPGWRPGRRRIVWTVVHGNSYR